MGKNQRKKMLAVFLSFAMILNANVIHVFAETDRMPCSTDGICQHHPVHTAECGYTQAVPESPCRFICSECTKQDAPETENTEKSCCCTSLCKSESVNTDCPVCGQENSELSLCMGTADEAEHEYPDRHILSWEFQDADAISENGIFVLYAAPFEGAVSEELAAFLPGSISAKLDNPEVVHEVAINGWNSALAEEASANKDSESCYILTASLEEGYICDTLPEIKVSFQPVSASNTETSGTSAGDFTVSGGTPGIHYTYGSNVLTIISGAEPLTVSGKTQKDRIVIKAGITVNLTIKDLDINFQSGSAGSGTRPIDMNGATVNLKLEGTNTLFTSAYKSALFCPKGSSLIIEGPGSLNATVDGGGSAAAIGGEAIAAYNSFLNAATFNWHASNDSICGRIVINSGTIEANCKLVKSVSSQYGAGIGGYGGGPIIINGGNITAVGTDTAIGIGSLSSDFEGITITGGKVTAKTYANIGSGAMDDMGASTSHSPAIGVVSGSGDEVPITISGGTVVASGNFGCAGIGGGRCGSGGDIHITGNANVTSTGGYGASGIGAGYAQNGGGNAGKITIDGNAVVNAKGGANAPAIGGGAPRQNGSSVGTQGDSGTIIIAGYANVTAHGGVYAPGIGSGGSQAGNFPDASHVQKIVITEHAVVNSKGGQGSICDIGPGYLGGSNPAPKERFHEVIITVELPNSPILPESQNSLTIDENGNYVVHGDVTLTNDLNIPDGKRLIIPDGSTLTVPSDITLNCPETSIDGIDNIIAGEASIDYFSVTFHSNGGSAIDAYSKIKKGRKISPPEVPEKNGFLFDGWYKDAALTVLWDFDYDTVTQNITLYAKWEELKKGITFSKIEPQIYTGKPVKPDITVYLDGKPQILGKDYTVSYLNNTNAAAGDAAKPPAAVITGKGNYKDKNILKFDILRKDIDSSDLIYTWNKYINYNKKQQTPSPIIKYNNKTLSKNKDYTISYFIKADTGFKTPLDCVTDTGEYIMKLEGKNNFTGTHILPFKITDNILVSKLKVSLTKKTITYTGIPVTLDNIEDWNLTVKHGSTILKSTADTLDENESAAYQVSYRNNKEIGKAAIIITGIDENGYSGTREIPFTIQGTSISKASVSKLNNLEYNGKQQQQEFSLSIGIGKNLKTLVKNADYTVDYSPAVNAGKVTVTIKGINHYSGTIKKTYNITPVNLMVGNTKNPKISVGDVKSCLQAKTGASPDVLLTFNPESETKDVYTLVHNQDYTLSYSNNKAVTTETKKAKVTVKGMGNFKGILKNIEFDITAKDFSSGNINIEAADMVYNAKKPNTYTYKPKVTVYDNGVKLSANEYTIDYGNNTQADVEALLKKDGEEITKGAVLTITVTAKAGNSKTPANYSGSRKTEFHITPYSVSKAAMKITPRTFTGYNIEDISQEDFSQCEYKISKDNIKPLTLGTDFVITSYKNNFKFGTAKVTVKGSGNLYGGTKTINFKIEKMSILEKLARLLNLSS